MYSHVMSMDQKLSFDYFHTKKRLGNYNCLLIFSTSYLLIMLPAKFKEDRFESSSIPSENKSK